MIYTLSHIGRNVGGFETKQNEWIWWDYISTKSIPMLLFDNMHIKIEIDMHMILSKMLGIIIQSMLGELANGGIIYQQNKFQSGKCAPYLTICSNFAQRWEWETFILNSTFLLGYVDGDLFLNHSEFSDHQVL